MRRATMVLRAAVEPMLINAIMTRTEREKRMLLIGTGVPMTAIWAGVSSEGSMRDYAAYLAEPGRKG